MKTVVVIPTHKTALSSTEHQNLKQNLQVLSRYDIRFALPESIERIPEFPGIQVEHFPNHYFTTVNSYNHLMLSEEFYTRFQSYDYMLICQTDAHIFRDELEDWSNRKYSYIGAPWLIKHKYHGLGRLLLWMRAIPYWMVGRQFWILRYGEHVGNGGLSLRHIPEFLQICQTEQKEIAHWLQRSEHRHEFNEDCFWSCRPGWNYPSVQEALHFSIDHAAEEAIQRLRRETKNPHTIPMGCHGNSFEIIKKI